MEKLSLFGEHLRSYRKRRGISQLELAASACSTPRYISFIETGRSRPGKGVVLRIAKVLNLTLRETNSLLVSAGLRAAFDDIPLDVQEMQPVRRIINQILKKHDPYPAWSIGPGLRFLNSNKAAEKLYPGFVGMEPKDLIDLWCSPDSIIDEGGRAEAIFQTINVI